VPTPLRSPPFPYTTLFRSALNVVRNFFPAAFRLSTGREIVTDLVEIDGFEILARPMRRERFFQKCFQAAQTELAHPIRVLFDVRDRKSTRLNSSHRTISYA